MADVCTDFGAVLVDYAGGGDHVVLVITHPATVAVSRLVNSLKGVSARRLRRSFPGEVDAASRPDGRFWSPSYSARSVGRPDDLATFLARA